MKVAEKEINQQELKQLLNAINECDKRLRVEKNRDYKNEYPFNYGWLSAEVRRLLNSQLKDRSAI